jgi:hypothetical protein
VGQCLHYRVASEFVSLLIGEEFGSPAYSVEALAEQITRFSLAGIRGFQERATRGRSRKERSAAEESPREHFLSMRQRENDER